MKKKIQLPQEMLDNVIKALENEDFKRDFTWEWDERTTFVIVEEYDNEPIYASYGFCEDSPRSSAPTPIIHLTVAAAGLKFTATQESGEIGRWQFDSDKYFITDEDMLEVENWLFENIEEVNEFEIDYPSSLSEEWTIEEVIEDILSELLHAQYISIDGEIYPLIDSLEEFLNKYNSEHNTNFSPESNGDYKLLTPEDVAERLADDIY